MSSRSMSSQSMSIQSRSIQSKSIQSMSIQSKSIQSKSIQSMSIQSMSIQSKSVKSKSIQCTIDPSEQSNGVQSMSIQSKSVQFMNVQSPLFLSSVIVYLLFSIAVILPLVPFCFSFFWSRMHLCPLDLCIFFCIPHHLGTPSSLSLCFIRLHDSVLLVPPLA